MIGRGIEAVRSSAYPGTVQEVRANALRGTLRAFEAARDGFKDPSVYSASPEQLRAPMIKTGIEMAIEAAKPGTLQERDAHMLGDLYNRLTEDGHFTDPTPMYRRVVFPGGHEGEALSRFKRVSKLTKDDIHLLAHDIGADIRLPKVDKEALKRQGVFYVPETLALLVQRETGVELKVGGEDIEMNLRDPRTKLDRQYVHLIEESHGEVIFWDRGYTYTRDPEWATQTRFTQEGHSRTELMRYADIPKPIADAFGPFDYA